MLGKSHCKINKLFNLSTLFHYARTTLMLPINSNKCCMLLVSTCATVQRKWPQNVLEWNCNRIRLVNFLSHWLLQPKCSRLFALRTLMISFKTDLLTYISANAHFSVNVYICRCYVAQRSLYINALLRVFIWRMCVYIRVVLILYIADFNCYQGLKMFSVIYNPNFENMSQISTTTLK